MLAISTTGGITSTKTLSSSGNSLESPLILICGRKGCFLNLRQRNISNFNVFVAPFVEQLDGANLLGNFLGENLVAIGRLNLYFAVVRHGEEWPTSSYST